MKNIREMVTSGLGERFEKQILTKEEIGWLSEAFDSEQLSVLLGTGNSTLSAFMRMEPDTRVAVMERVTEGGGDMFFMSQELAKRVGKWAASRGVPGFTRTPLRGRLLQGDVTPELVERIEAFRRNVLHR